MATMNVSLPADMVAFVDEDQATFPPPSGILAVSTFPYTLFN